MQYSHHVLNGVGVQHVAEPPGARGVCRYLGTCREVYHEVGYSTVTEELAHRVGVRTYLAGELTQC